MTAALELFQAIESHALASGLFQSVNRHEPKQAPVAETAPHCAIWLQTIGPPPAGSGLASTSVRVEFNVRIYASFVSQPEDMIDPALLNAAFELMEDYTGDFTLGNVTAVSVRQVDLLGAYGTPLSASAGYINQDGSIYRVVTITLPVVVDDLWTQTA